MVTACNSLRWSLWVHSIGISLLDFAALGKVGLVELAQMFCTATDSTNNGSSHTSRTSLRGHRIQPRRNVSSSVDR
jgi:hypothetical protein